MIVKDNNALHAPVSVNTLLAADPNRAMVDFPSWCAATRGLAEHFKIKSLWWTYHFLVICQTGWRILIFLDCFFNLYLSLSYSAVFLSTINVTSKSNWGQIPTFPICTAWPEVPLLFLMSICARTNQIWRLGLYSVAGKDVTNKVFNLRVLHT